MAAGTEIKVPDIGDFDAVEVIEVLVAAGDTVEQEQPLITLESDKATMEVPATAAGKVAEVKIKEGDKVAEGDVIVVLEEGAGEEPTRRGQDEDAPEHEQAAEPRAAEPDAKQDDARQDDARQDDARQDDARQDDARQEDAGRDDAGRGGEEETQTAPRRNAGKKEAQRQGPGQGRREAEEAARGGQPRGGGEAAAEQAGVSAHASPAVRKFARELGVELAQVSASGPKGRILKEDVQGYVKKAVARPAGASGASAGAGLPQQPDIDFSQFGDTETVPLSRIRRISARAVHKSWLLIPHVTQFDEADITELEAFRQAQKQKAERQGVKLTMLAFLLKASAVALEDFPDLNSSLAPDGENLIRKRYCHIGVAVDTEAGLVVPVLRDVNKKGVFELARELAEVSGRARDGKLKPDDLKGGCFSISSLGGIGGTAFTPIVNAPEVAILGVSRAQRAPRWNGQDFEPRLMLPLSLSYDHRVIDGAEAARITTFLAEVLGDIRKLLL